MKLKELRERRGGLEAKYNNVIAAAERENRDITGEEAEQLSSIIKEDKELKARIERQEHSLQWGRELDQPLDHRISGRGSAAGDGFGGDSRVSASEMDKAVSAFVRNSHGKQVSPDEWEGAEAYGYRPGASGCEVALNKIRPTVGRHANLFVGPRNAMSTAVPSQGGITIPAGFGSSFETALKLYGPMLQTSEIWTTDTGAESPYPMLDDTADEGELVAENGASSEGDMSFSGMMFRAHKLGSKIIRVSQELIEDSALDLASEVGKALGARLGRGANRLLTLGTNANEPQGIVPASALGKETASATAIAADEILDLIASVDPAYRSVPTCGFMMSDTVFSYLAKLKDGYGRYLLDDLKTPLQPMLRGFPVAINNHMTTSIAAGEKTVLFGDLAKFKVRLVRQIRLRTLSELYATTDQLGFVGFMRLDGGLLDAGQHPVKHLLQKAS